MVHSPVSSVSAVVGSAEDRGGGRRVGGGSVGGGSVGGGRARALADLLVDDHLISPHGARGDTLNTNKPSI